MESAFQTVRNSLTHIPTWTGLLKYNLKIHKLQYLLTGFFFFFFDSVVFLQVPDHNLWTSNYFFFFLIKIKGSVEGSFPQKKHFFSIK